MCMKLETVVDRLGQLKTQIAAMQEEAQQLQDYIAHSNQSVIEGKRFCATVLHSRVETVDLVALVDRLQPSHQMLAAYTTYAARVQVRVVAR